MTRILAPILLLTLLFPSLALGETLDDLVERDGLSYKKFSLVPFTGKITGRIQGKIKNGKEEGPWVTYYENGQLFSKGTYKNGKEEGPWVTYYDNGQLWSKGTFKNGKEEGPWVFYNSNGQKIYTGAKIGTYSIHEGSGTYRNGKLVK